MDRTRFGFALLGATALNLVTGERQAHAEYQGLQVQLHTQVIAGGGLRDVWHVYAAFSDPGDFLTAVVGAPSLGVVMHIQSLDAGGDFSGGDFYNPNGNPLITWDTAPAIGNFGDLEFFPPDGFDDFINGPEYITSNGGWFTAGPVAQGMAGNGVSLGGGLWGVLTMQLTVNAGNHVRGTVAIGGVNNSPLAGGTTFQTMANQTFNSLPAPGSLALLTLAGLMRRRRRSFYHRR